MNYNSLYPEKTYGYLLIAKADIPDSPDTLHIDVIDSMRLEAGENNYKPRVPHTVRWVKSNRKWGYADLRTHWLFVFVPCKTQPAPIVILPTIYLILPTTEPPTITKTQQGDNWL